ncbi:MAG: hypothetical protein WCJ40_15370 [Planctomycetota bacterium]
MPRRSTFIKLFLALAGNMTVMSESSFAQITGPSLVLRPEDPRQGLITPDANRLKSVLGEILDRMSKIEGGKVTFESKDDYDGFLTSIRTEIETAMSGRTYTTMQVGESTIAAIVRIRDDEFEAEKPSIDAENLESLAGVTAQLLACIVSEGMKGVAAAKAAVALAKVMPAAIAPSKSTPAAIAP